MYSRAVGTAVIVMSFTYPLAAFADTTAKVVAVPSAPLTITRCTYQNQYGYTNDWTERVNLRNRSNHPLISAEVRFQMFDDEGPVGENVLTVRPDGDVLAPGDDLSFSNNINDNQTAPVSTVRYATCRIQSATFTRGRTWTYGQTYGEKLMPLTAPRVAGPVSDDAPANAGQLPRGTLAAVPSTADVGVTLGQAWVSHPPNSGTFVHVRVTVSSMQPISVSPNQFHMNLALGNGASKEYVPLEQPAPRVLRGGLLTYTGDPNELTPSIAPNEDFGAIGQMSLQAKVPVTTVLTYQVDLAGGSGSVRSINFIP